MGQCYINMVVVRIVRSGKPRDSGRTLDLSLYPRLRVNTMDSKKLVSIPELFSASNNPNTTAPKHIIIHGGAGMGKSTLCKKTMHDYLNQGMWNNLFDLILWIPLQRLKHRSQQNHTLESAFYNLYFYSNLKDGKDLAIELGGAILDAARKDRILLILDGLDEVSQEWEPDTPMHSLLGTTPGSSTSYHYLQTIQLGHEQFRFIRHETGDSWFHQGAGRSIRDDSYGGRFSKSGSFRHWQPRYPTPHSYSCSTRRSVLQLGSQFHVRIQGKVNDLAL
ncbi:uncharacterized protein BDV17DRAFT_100454 [Aspergillus undulatus]|uniref:uncharacterized protein n=1 Tax=Aspergillus undulatus TaxID=1810928 RepID=UPI003CCCFB2D